MASTQLRNQLTATDMTNLTPLSTDGSARTPVKDYLLEVELVNQPISIDLFKDANTSYDPFLELIQISKGSKGQEAISRGLLIANDDNSGGYQNSRIAFTSQPGVDYVIRVGTFGTITSIPQPFTLQVSTPYGTVPLKDLVTGATLDAGGNIIGGGDPLTGNLPVRRFFDKVAGSHFYTTDPTEKADRLNNPARYQSEGDEFIAPANGNAKVQRFFNTASGTYFYTNQPTDIQFIRDNLPQFRAEGEVFNSYNTPVSGAVPVYRFTNLARERENPLNITHFFTASQADRLAVQARPDFRDEGVAFYALPSV